MLIGPLPDAYVEQAVALWNDTGLTRPWNDPRADLHRALAAPASTVLAGIVDEMLVATAMIGHDGHRGWIYYLAVRPDEQRHGFGREMMRACEAWLIERRVPKLNLMVREENATAVAFYTRLGYSRDDVVTLSRRLVDR